MTISWQFFVVFGAGFAAGFVSMSWLVADKMARQAERYRRLNPPPAPPEARFPSNVNKYPPHTWGD